MCYNTIEYVGKADYMIVDFHTHIFPDKIAAQTVSALAEKGNTKPYGKATLDDIRNTMKNSGVDYSVILPVATSPKQVASINRMAAEINGTDGIIYAGAIHPQCEYIEEILDGIKQNGLSVIKIHPDYQGERFDSPAYIRIMAEAAKRGIVTVTHAGVDIGYPDDVHCSPDMVLNVLDELKGIIDDKLVLAHMGGCDLPDEVLEKLIGKPVYFDTSFVLDRYEEKCREIIMKHGFDRILLATDYPWSDVKKFVEIIKGFGFTEEENEKIFYKNALKLIKG